MYALSSSDFLLWLNRGQFYEFCTGNDMHEGWTWLIFSRPLLLLNSRRKIIRTRSRKLPIIIIIKRNKLFILFPYCRLFLKRKSQQLLLLLAELSAWLGRHELKKPRKPRLVVSLVVHILPRVNDCSNKIFNSTGSTWKFFFYKKA